VDLRKSFPLGAAKKRVRKVSFNIQERAVSLPSKNRKSILRRLKCEAPKALPVASVAFDFGEEKKMFFVADARSFSTWNITGCAPQNVTGALSETLRSAEISEICISATGFMDNLLDAPHSKAATQNSQLVCIFLEIFALNRFMRRCEGSMYRDSKTGEVLMTSSLWRRVLKKAVRNHWFPDLVVERVSSMSELCMKSYIRFKL